MGVTTIKAVVSLKIQAEFNVTNGETVTVNQSYEVPVDAGRRVDYGINWYETWQVGETVIVPLNLRIPFRVRTGLEGELSSGSPQTCPPSSTLSTINVTLPTNTLGFATATTAP